jgi:hypothetical protein
VVAAEGRLHAADAQPQAAISDPDAGRPCEQPFAEPEPLTVSAPGGDQADPDDHQPRPGRNVPNRLDRVRMRKDQSGPLMGACGFAAGSALSNGNASAGIG